MAMCLATDDARSRQVGLVLEDTAFDGFGQVETKRAALKCRSATWDHMACQAVDRRRITTRPPRPAINNQTPAGSGMGATFSTLSTRSDAVKSVT